MTSIRLPETLRTGSELEQINRDLRAGAAQLDWSEVREAGEGALASLLASLDLAADVEVLGLSTVPDGLQDSILRVLLANPPGGQTGGFGRADRGRAEQGSATTRRADVARNARPLPDVSLEESAVPHQGGHAARKPGRDTRRETPGRSEAPVPDRQLAPPSAGQIREELQQLVLADLLGPAGGPDEEVDEDRVRERYLVGALAPCRQAVGGGEDDAFAVAGDDTPEEGVPEPDTVGPDTMFPSSLGLSFFVDEEASALRITVRYGRYLRLPSEYTTTSTGEPKMIWKRVPVENVHPALPVKNGPIAPWAPDPEKPDVSLKGLIRHHREGGWFVTLFLLNEQEERTRLKDTAWLFQPEVVVEDVDGGAVFLHRPLHRAAGEMDQADFAEERAMAMLYRNQLEFAAGHGVGVHAETPPDAVDRAFRVSTRVVPQYALPETVSPTPARVPGLSDLTLDMKWLAELERDALLANLELLPAAYGRWIEAQRRRIGDPAARLAGFEEAAAGALDTCERTRGRIREGISLLARDDRAMEAFRFMNRAMWQQRVHTVYAEEVRRGGKPTLERIDRPDNRCWRLFQLAFILLNLPGVTDLHHPDRTEEGEAVADLLWFPTGGGKTEAYLGLTAYTIALRRLQGTVAGRSGGYGIAVLMRYTLRLLTLQQFQRAAALICACEIIRQDAWQSGHTIWGSEPFRIGLWVGQRTTPNRTEQSAEAVKQEHGEYHRASSIGGSGSPHQLTNCPWCGATIEPGKHIKVESVNSGRGRTLVYCGDPLGRCRFSERQAAGEGLPVLTVDEEIYRRLPALLIGTVDKFAQMAWKGETQMLFGYVDSRCERHGFRSPDLDDSDSHPARPPLERARTIPVPPLRPPDLIIQDELHLISGPLGTLVGLYETAVDALSSWEVDGRRVRPKVIASTATIRRASQQVHGLFLRTVNVFPPQGLDVDDNFFARQLPPGEAAPGRLYLGICAPGRRLKAALIRVYVAYLAAGQRLYEKYGSAADPWMTLVGYFNSMRELGGMRRLVDDDVRSRLRRTVEHGLANRPPPQVEELTSRKGSTDIPYVLDRLERPFDHMQQRERPARNKRRGSGPAMPIDVLLATNMVSVGVDVQRLGLMVVAGQPKTTAEYIQATSRVGRKHPGVVCTVFNWTRPRDLSHYERFEHYHATFYQQVEALSVTPFAPRAIDRALTALFVSLVRLVSDDLNANVQAGKLRRDHPSVRAAIDTITDRAWRVTHRAEVRDLVRAELERRLEEWLAQAEQIAGGRQLGYQSRNDGVTIGLLQRPDTDPWGTFTCLTSLRDVEPEVRLILDDRGLDDEPVLVPVAEPEERAFDFEPIRRESP